MGGSPDRKGRAMIEVYGGQTPNVFKVLIALEELAIDYGRIPVDIMAGEQFTPQFLAISPNNRVPAIVDGDPADGGEPLSVFESGATLLYLADKANALIPNNPRARSKVVEWVTWQMAGQGPMFGQAGHFRNYAPEKIPYAIERYTNEAARLYRVLDTQLQGREFIAGAYSIADIVCWPWLVFRTHHGIPIENYPDVARWFHAIESRPAVRRALGDFTVPLPPTFDEKARALLFGHRRK
jgi:GSH-dependent disulfide-bond oxidoreductase